MHHNFGWKSNSSRTSKHFLQEAVRFDFPDLGIHCIKLAAILEDLGRKISDRAKFCNKFLNLGSTLEEND